MLRLDRSGDRPVRFLEWRIRLFGAGAILAVFGIGADVELLRWAAFAVLAAAAVMSLVAARADVDDSVED